MKKILVADDHQIIIDGIEQILEGNEEYRVTASANDGKEALRLLERQQFDIAILDISMPQLDGIELTKLICERFPHIWVLILTMYNKASLFTEIMTLGHKRSRALSGQLKNEGAGGVADFGIGVILKNKGKEELVKALETICTGKNYYGDEVKDTILNSWAVEKGKPPREPDSFQLTSRERDVLKLIAAGKKTQEMAYTLGVAKSTIETHRRHLISKCGVSRSVDLVRFAIENGYS
jgi:DNA-binding NarL/FixJ family response regulator